MLPSRIFYICDDELIQECDRLPAVLGRATMVHDLIASYGLLSRVQLVRSTPATHSELLLFHSESYLNHLKKHVIVDDDYLPNADDEEYGIVYDCPPVSEMFKLVSTIVGGSIAAAKCLVLGIADIAINWCGGWHHAQRSAARGFCYTNDVIVAVEKLKQKFPKVLYVDLDIHHGDGVEEAYITSKSVFTLSFHKYEPGFFPGTGALEEIGSSDGAGYTCNCTLNDGYTDTTLEYVFERVFAMVYKKFNPDAIVVQCGADALAHDPHGGAGLTLRGYCRCVEIIINEKKPTLLLGGGGYKHENVARLWTSLTALVAGVQLDQDIPPDHDGWPNYGPSYTLSVDPTLARDLNTKDYLDMVISTIEMNLKSKDEVAAKESLADHKKSTGKTELAASTSTQPHRPNKIFTYKETKQNKQPEVKKSFDVFEFHE